MRNIFILLTVLCSTIGFAQQVRPQLFTFTNNVQVTTSNYTNEGVRCSGYIYARTFKGRMETHFYNEIIYRGMTSHRNFYIRDYSDRYTYSHHNIFCNRF
jgi:hypothetical protein